MRRPAPSKTTIGSHNTMLTLISLQRADGSWELADDFAAVLGYDVQRLESVLRDASGDNRETRTAWATALALAWLEAHAADLEDQWRLLARKARAWLKGVSAAGPRGAVWLHAAEEFMKNASSAS